MATALADLRSGESVARLWAADHTLWRPDETEVSDRLGWLTVMPEMMIELEALRAQCLTLSEGTDHVVIMGMGGSSLFPHDHHIDRKSTRLNSSHVATSY